MDDPNWARNTGCGYKSDQNDICGETYTCANCARAREQVDEMAVLRGQISDLQDIVRLLVAYERRRTTDQEKMAEIDEATCGTPMYWA